MLGYVTKDDVRIEEGFSVVPQMLQESERSTEGQNTQGAYSSTTTEEAVKNPLKSGKAGFMGRGSAANIAATYDAAEKGRLDEFYATERTELEKKLKAANKTASGNRFNKKPAATAKPTPAAKPAKPAPKSDL